MLCARYDHQALHREGHREVEQDRGVTEAVAPTAMAADQVAEAEVRGSSSGRELSGTALTLGTVVAASQ